MANNTEEPRERKGRKLPKLLFRCCEYPYNVVKTAPFIYFTYLKYLLTTSPRRLSRHINVKQNIKNKIQNKKNTANYNAQHGGTLKQQLKKTI